jgi:hypothetical protein
MSADPAEAGEGAVVLDEGACLLSLMGDGLARTYGAGQRRCPGW